ncbi:hybrid sensor histidine kinase/response regulator [Pseudomonas piscis]|uniref:hybrid sensor histidine kinase/response regulator n=1 Tax=Pseudomonas piscis TaxID=2614538 RepID=UPI0021D5CE74|nr:hybrid sensor histidine kinase/response regulator [Pseudomonas piscis]MCU7646342.1 response regulator [Pseudomonas piscis]
MKYIPLFLEYLARYQARLNLGLLILLGLALLCSTLGWVAMSLAERQSDHLRVHFTRLMENIQEQELFLKHAASLAPASSHLGNNRYPLPLHHASWSLAQNNCNDRQLPGSLLLDRPLITNGLPRLLMVGMQLSTFYRSFWSDSRHSSPKVLLLNACSGFDLASLAPRTRSGKSESRDDAGGPSVPELRLALLKRQRLAPQQVNWQPYPQSGPTGRGIQLLAHTTLRLAPTQLQMDGADGWMKIVSLLALDETGKQEGLLAVPVYDDFTLIDPAGTLLVGSQNSATTLHDGLNFGHQGIILKLTSHTPPLWTGLYGISYRKLYGQAPWVTASLLGLILAAFAWGWGISRWQLNRKPIEIRTPHEQVAESEAFSHTIIETVPMGLCVVRREDFKLLLENPCARQGGGSDGLLSILEQDPHRIDNGESCLAVGGRHLQVKFVATRYQNQEAVLCAFNDITRQVENSRALEQARHAADLACKARARFLAIMSHRLRTPLYAALGTLELLGLTPLDPRQTDYLHTSQRCSNALLQLISNILDISRIEAGHISIAPVEFCPLDMAEAALQEFAAAAKQRGLLLYAYIDPKLPDLLRGDARRIRQILDNLLGNAIKFTDSGRVVLRLRLLGSIGQRACIEWQITDTGIGIPAAHQTQLFDLPQQLGDTSSRAGLGLPLCQQLCTLMAGQLQVTSEPGLGSSFSLRLDLPHIPGSLPGVKPLEEGPPVHVRAPAPELLKNTCDWLNRLGIQASPAPADWSQLPQQRVLVDLLPRTTLCSWPGALVSALCDPSQERQPQDQEWIVSAYDIRAIAEAASRARQGQQFAATPAADSIRGPLCLHVLVAEDNPLNQAIIQEQLQALGCRTTVAANGEQALQYWQPRLFDLVLADLEMPLMDGYELARQLRRRDPRLPIIGITANALGEERSRCFAAGMNTWIVKPMDLQHLWRQLSQLCPPRVDALAPLPPAPRPTEPERQQLPQLSPRMRPLFVETMNHDLQHLDHTLASADLQSSVERLHSIAGALGAVQVTTLARACAEMECRLRDEPWSASLEQQVRQLMQRLSELLAFIE